MSNTSEVKCKVCFKEVSIFAINQGIVELDYSTIPVRPICNECNKNRVKSTKTLYQSLIEKIEQYYDEPDIWSDILDIAKEIEPYDTNEDYCYPDIQMDCSGKMGRVGKNSWDYCGGCYDGFMGPVSWKAYENLLSNNYFSKLKKSQIEQIYAEIQNIEYPIKWETSDYEKDKKEMHPMDFYMKYEYQFENYSEAREWYESQYK